MVKRRTSTRRKIGLGRRRLRGGLVGRFSRRIPEDGFGRRRRIRGGDFSIARTPIGVDLDNPSNNGCCIS